MEDKTVTSDSTQVKSFFSMLERIENRIDQITANCRPTLSGDLFLSDREVAARLKVGRRTLSDYRTQGILPFHLIGGKILYKESDIQRVLDQNYFGKTIK